MAEKPRQVVEGLGALPQLTPAADPRALDSYTRPQAAEIGRPASTNPMLQLSEALGKLEPALIRGVSMAGEQYGEEEYAKGVEEFWKNREKWNAEIRAGRLPEGASPYFQRGLQRAALKQMAGDFYAQTHADFYGEAGAEARQSNDPAVMAKFLHESRERFTNEKLKDGDRSLFSALDLQEVFNPSAEQTYKTMLQTHAAYRVSEREKEYEALSTAQIDAVVERNLAQIQPTDSNAVREQWIAQAAREANDVLYNPDTGAVRNGMLASKGNQLLIDTITTKMMKTGNRAYADVLAAITTKDGASIAKTQYAQAKILAAEEHITDQQMKLEHFQHWRESLPFEKASREHTIQSWQREDQRWERERAAWQRQDSAIAQDEIISTLSRRIFEGLRRTDAAEGTRIIDEALREAEKVSWKDAEHLKNMVHTVTKQRADYDDDRMTVAQLRISISRDPLGFKYDTLVAAVKDKLLKPSTMLQMVDDLERNKQNADHPYMRQPEFTSMLHKVEKSMANQMGDDEFGEGAIRAAEAVGEFRDLAVEWIEKNPQGSIAAFRNYMRTQIPEVAERINAAYGDTQRKHREKQQQLGERIRDTTGAEVGEREQKRKDAEEEKRQAQERKEAPERERKEREKREREKLEDNIRSFRDTGKTTSEGRKIMQREDGAIVTEKTVTVTDKRINDGRPTNIPTIYGGKFYTEKEAVDIIARNNGVDPDTGRKLRGYYSINDAVIAARERSARLGKEYGSTETSKKVTPQHLRTLLTAEQKKEIGELKQRVENPGTGKPATKEQLKDRVMDILKPHYSSSADLAEGVEEFMRVLLPQQKKDK